MMTQRVDRLTPFIRLGAVPILVGLILWLLPSPDAFSMEGACLTLKSAVAVDGKAVRLADIAQLSGIPAARRNTWGAVVVAGSPLPGQSRLVGSDTVRLRLRQAGVDSDAVIFKGSREVRVTRRSKTLPVQRIRQAVETTIRNRMPWKSEDAVISDITFDETIHLPTGKLSFRIDPNPNDDYLGRTLLALRLFVDGEPVRKIWVNATIAVMAEVVTVARPLGKHQHIEFSDVTVERRDLADLPSDTVTRLDAAVGNRVTRMLYPGTVLQSDMISLPPVVRRGDMVKIVASAGPMTITATGMVKQQGCTGERVQVVNTDSNRIITARVTGPGTVEVDF